MNLTEQQKQSIGHLREWKVGALFMEPGTGKTRASMELVNSVPDIDLVVWIGPLQTIRPKEGLSGIKDEIEKWGGLRAPVRFCGVESISASDRIYLELRNEMKAARKPFLVVDESIKIKNMTAKRTHRLLDLSSLAEYKLVLNGTPLTKNLLDLWSQMEFLSPKILGMSYAKFKNTFCRYTTIQKRGQGGTYFTKEYVTGYENVDYLHSLIRHYVYQCDLSLNVGQQYRDIQYAVSDGERAEYLRIKEKFLEDDELLLRNNNIFLAMTNAMQHLYCCSEDKFRQLDALMKEIPEERTLIFCRYVRSQDACRARYPKAQVLSYQKESFGLNLQQFCHTVYFDKVWDLALRIQSARRTFRTGQEYDCRYYDFTGNVGLESLMDRCIEKKVSMTEYFKKVSIEELRKDL